jgi:hypothetical protein
MPKISRSRGSKAKYTGKQDRKADHIAKGYEASGVPHKEAERRAWATVNKESGGGKKSGSGKKTSSGRKKRGSATKKSSGGRTKKSGKK